MSSIFSVARSTVALIVYECKLGALLPFRSRGTKLPEYMARLTLTPFILFDGGYYPCVIVSATSLSMGLGLTFISGDGMTSLFDLSLRLSDQPLVLPLLRLL